MRTKLLAQLAKIPNEGQCRVNLESCTSYEHLNQRSVTNYTPLISSRGLITRTFRRLISNAICH